MSVTVAFAAAYWLRFNVDLFPVRPMPDASIHMRVSLFSGIIGLLCMQVNNMYAVHFRRITLDLVFGIARSMCLSGFLVILISFLFRELIVLSGQETMSRLILVLSFFFTPLVMILWRIAAFKLLGVVRRQGWAKTNVLLVGLKKSACDLSDLKTTKGL